MSQTPCEPGCGCRKHRRTASTRARISAALRGERNPAWKGDGARHSAVHTWLNRHWRKAGRCEECGQERRTDWAFTRHPEPHTRRREDYRELCRSCHQREDAARRRAQAEERNRQAERR